MGREGLVEPSWGDGDAGPASTVLCLLTCQGVHGVGSPKRRGWGGMGMWVKMVFGILLRSGRGFTMRDLEGELYRAEVEKAGAGKAEAGVPMQVARVEQRGGGCRTEMGLGIGFCMVVLGKHIRGKRAGAATVARERLAFWAAVEMGRGVETGFYGGSVGRQAGARGRDRRPQR